MLTGPDLPVVPYVPCTCTPDHLFHNLPRLRGQMDKPGVPWTFPLALLVDGRHICYIPVNWDLPD